jgi:glycerol-3-phosphate dehydrogenase
MAGSRGKSEELMKRDLDQLSSQQFDLLVIGGGINGAAVANLAAFNGLKVALIEKGDFAGGTSSKSTKLVHGGLRYLENFDFGLVAEALKERYIQIQSAPHLIKPLEFIIPVYKSDPRPLWQMKIGVALYDFLCGKYRLGKHAPLSAEQIRSSVDGIASEGLVGGVSYFDAQMDDARLCLENILSARSYGAQVFNYVEAKRFVKENGRAAAVVAIDRITKKDFEIRAKRIVSAVGPWTDHLLQIDHKFSPSKVRMTKGVHIVYRKRFSEHPLFLQAKNDKRMFFVVPWHDGSLIGTTDTDYTRSPDDVKVNQEDIDYIFREVQRFFPDEDFNKDNIITTFAGLRPLVRKEGAPSKISRRHVIEESFSKIVFIMGGKYTTYRLIAEDALKMVTKKPLKDIQEIYPLFGGGKIKDDLSAKARECGIDLKLVEHLVEVYGTKYSAVLDIIKEDKDLKQPVCRGARTIKAQVVYALRHELALNKSDIIERRTSLIYEDCSKPACESSVEELIYKYKDNQ